MSIDIKRTLEHIKETRSFKAFSVGKCKLTVRYVYSAKVFWLEGVRLESKYRGSGEATKALAALMDALDSMNEKIRLHVQPMDKKTSTDGLVRLYSRFGFKKFDDGSEPGYLTMERKPRKKKETSMSLASLSRMLTSSGVDHIVIALSSNDTTWDDDLKILNDNRKLYDIAKGPKPSLLKRFVEKYKSNNGPEFGTKALEVKRLIGIINADWNTLFETYFEKTHGRKPTMSDYRISGIGDDQLSDAQKDKLRELAHKSSDLSRLYVVFQALSKKRTIGDSVVKAWAGIAKLFGYKPSIRVIEYEATAGGKDMIRVDFDPAKRVINYGIKENGIQVVDGMITADMSLSDIQGAINKIAKAFADLKRLKASKGTR